MCQNLINADFRGNVYVVQGENVLLEYVGGFADLANRIPNTLETKFASASAGKVFVAVGILQLIEKGKLHFRDTLGSLLDMDLHQIDADVTVEQLRELFGERIASLVHAESDQFTEGVSEEDSWHDRKKAAIDRLAAASGPSS